MSSVTTDPTVFDWSTLEAPTATAVAVPTATALEAAVGLGRFELTELEARHSELRGAVEELAVLAGRSWDFGPADPTIVFVRAAAVLAGRTPEVAGPKTAVLVAALDG